MRPVLFFDSAIAGSVPAMVRALVASSTVATELDIRV